MSSAETASQHPAPAETARNLVSISPFFIVKDLQAYETFIKSKLTRLKGIASIETSFALDQVKRAEALPVG